MDNGLLLGGTTSLGLPSEDLLISRLSGVDQDTLIQRGQGAYARSIRIKAALEMPYPYGPAIQASIISAEDFAVWRTYFRGEGLQTADSEEIRRTAQALGIEDLNLGPCDLYFRALVLLTRKCRNVFDAAIVGITDDPSIGLVRLARILRYAGANRLFPPEVPAMHKILGAEKLGPLALYRFRRDDPLGVFVK